MLLLLFFVVLFVLFFFFNDTATTEIYTLSLHDALPIYGISGVFVICVIVICAAVDTWGVAVDIHAYVVVVDMYVVVVDIDRKSTRLNSSHGYISYAVFCLKKKTNNKTNNKTNTNYTNRSIIIVDYITAMI